MGKGVRKGSLWGRGGSRKRTGRREEEGVPEGEGRPWFFLVPASTSKASEKKGGGKGGWFRFAGGREKTERRVKLYWGGGLIIW